MGEHREAQHESGTGVAWCMLSVSDETLQLVYALRSSERRVCTSLSSGGIERHLRAIVTDGVDAAQVLAQNPTLTTQQLFEQCFSLTGTPWEQAPRRRDMRERIRMHRALEQGVAVPRDPSDPLDLWACATSGEIAWYSECETPQFRTRDIPFGHGKDPFHEAPPPPGCETVAAEDIPREVDALLAFIQRDDLPSCTEKYTETLEYRTNSPLP